jgi:hypothetical protein
MLPCPQAKKSSKKQQLLQKMSTSDLSASSISISKLDALQQQKQQQQQDEGGAGDEVMPLLMGQEKQGTK